MDQKFTVVTIKGQKVKVPISPRVNAISTIFGVVCTAVLFAPVIFFVHSCASSSSESSAGKFTYAEEVHARDKVRAQLKDPDSAQFGDMTKGTDSGTIYGTVNAKNGFGGYAGYVKFAVYADGRVVMVQ